jgi:hypothetical protein
VSTSFASINGRLIRSATAPAFRRFLRSLDDPAAAQQRVRETIVRDSSRSAYGQSIDLRKPDAESAEAFRKKLPIADYENLQPWIERAVFEHQRGMLSPHKIVRVEATSGSSAGTKWIPYTRPMMRTFSRMFTLWAHDLLSTKLYQPHSGRLYLCVTGGRPDDGSLASKHIGDDRDYLGKCWRTVLDRFVIAPQFARADDPLERLAIALDGEPDLEVMSFWSPSLLLAVLSHMGVSSAEETRRRWPKMQLISCWTAASSSRFADRVRELFPEVRIQGKGLLSTEAALTIPLEQDHSCQSSDDEACIPLFEFIDNNGDSHEFHQLNDGSEYEVLLSNRAGFLRYRIGDRVRVRGKFRNTPRLEFIGRAGVICDLVGEKLTLEFVEKELGDELGTRYFCLLPVEKGYQLWIDGQPSSMLAEKCEAALCQSFHYARARKLEQLQPLDVRFVQALDEHIRQATEEKNSHRARAFKPPLMISDRSTAELVSRELMRRLPANTE